MAKISAEQAIAELNGCFSKLSNSPAGYILSAFPYISDADKAAVGTLKEIFAAEQALALECENMIVKREGIPLSGLPNPDLAELNYLSFPYLLDALSKEMERELPFYKRRVERLAGDSEAGAFAEKLYAERQAQIAKIKGVRQGNYKSAEPAAPNPEPAADPAAESAEPAATA